MHTFDMSSSPVVGFARCDLAPAMAIAAPERYPLCATCAAFRSSDGRVFVIASLDLLELTPAFCGALRREMAAALGAEESCIVIHTTHTHSSPNDYEDGPAPFPGLGAVLAACARTALARAVPVVGVRAARADVGQRLSIHRRGDAGPDLGLQTFWFGFQFRDGDDVRWIQNRRS